MFSNQKSTPFKFEVTQSLPVEDMIAPNSILVPLETGKFAIAIPSGKGAENWVNIWEEEQNSWKITHKLPGTIKDHLKGLTTISTKSDGIILASAQAHKTIRLWKPKKEGWECIQTLTDHKSSILSLSSIQTSKGDSLLVSAGGAHKDGGGIKLWQEENGSWKCVQTLYTDYVMSLTTFTASDNKPTLVSGGYDGSIKLWQEAKNSWKCVQSYTAHKGAVRALTALNTMDNEIILASGGDDTLIKLWNPENPTLPIEELGGHISSVVALTSLITKSGKNIIVSSCYPLGKDVNIKNIEKHGIKIWEKEEDSWWVCKKTLAGYSATSFSLLPNKDGEITIVGAYDKIIFYKTNGFSKISSFQAFDSPTIIKNPSKTPSIMPSTTTTPDSSSKTLDSTTIYPTYTSTNNNPFNSPTIIKDPSKYTLPSTTTNTTSFSLIPYSDIKVCKDTSDDPIVLGQGGFGIVYKAKWKNKDAAFKELLAQNINPDIEEEFAKETNVMMQLKHENIIKLYGICLSPKHYGMLMEFMPKGSLFDVLQSGMSLSWKQRYDMAYDITAGLQYLHKDQNILHRDLKSLNILVGDNLRLKISDFGLARIKFSSSMPTLDKQVGTLRWMAPELCNTKPHYTKACDIYSYSIILWEITSRKIPWSDAVNQFEIMLKLMGGEREKIPDKTPISFASLISKCWEQRGEDRLTISEAMDTLKNNQDAIVNYKL